MGRSAVILALVALACSPTPPASVSRALAVAKEPPAAVTEPAAKPVPVAAPAEEASVPPSAAVEPEPAPAVCNAAALTAELAKFEKDLEHPELGPPTFADLEDWAESKPGRLGDLDRGLAFFGPRDFDADGKPDHVRLFTSVDYWLWFLFESRDDCVEFVGAVPGYQIEALSTKRAGHRELTAWTYPLQGHAERYAFRAGAYVRVGP